MEKVDGVYTCLLCGRGYQSPHDRKRFLETNKEAIIKDYKELGRAKTIQKWQISSSGWSTLARRWGLKPMRKERSDVTRRKAIRKITRGEHDELVYLRGYKQAVIDLMQGGAVVKLRSVDKVSFVVDNKKEGGQ